MMLRQAASTSGSSPLTRGKHVRRIQRLEERGLIPAHAGKTGEFVGDECPGWAHPRSRGENASGGGRGAFDVGSSPLTRGKPRRGERLNCLPFLGHRN